MGQGRPALRRAAESLGRPRPPASAASHAPLLLRELTGLWVSTPLGAPGSCRRPTRRGQCLCRSRHCPFAMASNAWQRGSQCSNGHAKPATRGRRIDPPAVPCWEWGQSRVRVAGPASGAWPWAPRLSLRMCFSSSAPLSLRAWSTVASHMSKPCHPLGVHTGRHPRPGFPAAGGRCLDGRDHSKS